MIPPDLYHAFPQIFKSIKLSIDNNLPLPSLMLIFAGIDISGWLGAETASLKTRESFTQWVDLYMLPCAAIPCSSIDLYSARCSILHTLTPDSDLSRSGKAKQIAYIWGDAKPEDLEFERTKGSESDLVMLHIGDTFSAFQSGWVKFIDTYEKDASVAPLFHERASKIFTHLTKVSYKE